MNPIVKLFFVIFYIILIFLVHSLLLNIVIFAFLFILWLFTKPQRSQLKFILITIILIFTLIFALNWMMVKAPTISIVDEKNIDFWFRPANGFDFKQFDNTPLSYIVTPNWGLSWDWTDYQFAPVHNINQANEAVKNLMQTQPDLFHKYAKNIVVGVMYNNEFHFKCLMYTSRWYSLSLDNILYAINITFKISLMIIVVTLWISNTDNVQLTYSIYHLLLPLRVFKAPVKEWSMIITLSIRFVPSLSEESKRILNAQASRGVDYGNGNFTDKIKALSSLIIPMFTIAFIKSNDLSNAMDARNYYPNTISTKYRKYKIRFSDAAFLFFTLFLWSFILTLSYFKILVSYAGIIDVYFLYGKF